MNNENEILEFLNKNGLRYLSKFETTESQFKSFLKKKIDVFEPNLSTSKKNEFIYLITEKMKKLNYVNDLRYSEIKGEKIFNSGGSKKLLKFKLDEKGIDHDVIEKITDKFFSNKLDEIQSALIYTKKKKIGLFYEKDLNKIDASNLKNKWFGALARRGFSYETAKKVFEIDNLSEAENIINRTV